MVYISFNNAAPYRRTWCSLDYWGVDLYYTVDDPAGFMYYTKVSDRVCRGVALPAVFTALPPDRWSLYRVSELHDTSTL